MTTIHTTTTIHTANQQQLHTRKLKLATICKRQIRIQHVQKEYNIHIVGGVEHNGERSIRTSMFPFYFVVFINNATDCDIIHRRMGGGGFINCELRGKGGKKGWRWELRQGKFR